MKLVVLKCPGCGAQLNVDEELKQATCPYCDMTFPIDDEVQHFKMDDAAQAGYEFEKGRQQAQAEFAAQQAPPQPQQVYVNVQAPPPPKKRKTWLWVLGWIFIFPVPLTILMLKNESMNKWVRYGIIAAGWLVYFAIAFGSGGSSKEKNDPSSGSKGVSTTAVQPSSSSSVASSDTFELFIS